MSDPWRILQKKFDEKHRHANFGNVIVKMVARGFRCHRETVLDIRSPITALCGLNGTGKTTLLHLAAAAFRSSRSFDYNLSDFFAVGRLDPAPFEDTASVTFNIWQDNRSPHEITLTRRPQTQRWSDYRRRQERHTFFVGYGVFLPRTERGDFFFRNASRLTIASTSALDEAVRRRCSNLLAQPYDGLHVNVVGHRGRKSDVLTAVRGTTSYSEAHMGCGEGRAQTLIRILEDVPEKSLILLEEPETALHQSAQSRLGHYLMDLSIRRGHQILLTTHSEHLLRALPQSSRVFLYRGVNGITTLPGIGASQAVSLMTEGREKALTVLVEDNAARCIVSEIVRKGDSQFLQCIRIVIGGYTDDAGNVFASGKDAIKAAMKTLRQSGLKIVAVLDGDATPDMANFIYTLPGTMPPELVIFNNPKVREYWQKTYDLDAGEFQAAMGMIDYHGLFDRLAGRLVLDRDFLLGEAARAYVDSLPVDVVRSLVERLTELTER